VHIILRDSAANIKKAIKDLEFETIGKQFLVEKTIGDCKKIVGLMNQKDPARKTFKVMAGGRRGNGNVEVEYSHVSNYQVSDSPLSEFPSERILKSPNSQLGDCKRRYQMNESFFHVRVFFLSHVLQGDFLIFTEQLQPHKYTFRGKLEDRMTDADPLIISMANNIEIFCFNDTLLKFKSVDEPQSPYSPDYESPLREYV
uniref:Uncharacterized protein n=1 Tax=Romanomermis culicivorax TaxID=13658 RepID=A0A915HKP2_ROMCU